MPAQKAAILTKGLYSPATVTGGGGITLPSYTAGPPNPVTDIKRFVMTRLLGDATVLAAVGGGTNPRIYDSVAPEDLGDDGDDSSEYPLIIFDVLTARHRTANGSLRGFTRPLVRIFAVNRTQDASTIEVLASRIDVLFSGRYMATLASIKIMGGFCEEAYENTEITEGVVYKSLGGEYRFFVHY